MTHTITRFIGTVLTVLALAPPLTATPLSTPAPGATAPVTLPPLPQADAAPDITVTFDAAVALYQTLRSQNPDQAARVLDLNLDPQAAFTLLRDGVASVAYDGHLRDPAAVFQAASGNAYDKALALADLLARMGYDTRLVQSDTPSPTPPTPSCGTGTVDAANWQATQLGAPTLARVPLRAAASYALLHSTLTPAAMQPTQSTQPHIWLQLRDGANWVDLDPWLPTTAYGDHPTGPGTPLQTPATHTVTLTLTLETLRDGTLAQRDILTTDLDVPQVTHSLIALGFGPRVEGLGGGLAEALGALDGSGAQMVANLMMNGDTRQSDAFTAPGTPKDGFLGAEAAPDLTTALFLTVTSHVPGQPDHAETRTILDLVPPALRQGTIDPATLLPATPGNRYPAALESLRLIVVSNGATSPRLMAAVGVRQLIDLPDVLTRADAGQLDGWDVLWGAWAQASRTQLAAEVLLQARPAHNGTCAVIDRPRVMISGLASAGDDRIMQWLDWTIDDYGLTGGDATAQAETRLWHGTLQAALEKEALLHLTQSPGDLIPLDTGTLQPAPSGLEADQDIARGYLTLATASMGPGTWWRINRATGAADARGLMHGNMAQVEWGAERALGSMRFGNGASTISEAQEAYLGARNNAQLLAELEQDLARIEAAAAEPRCGGNEYLILETCVSIPISIAVGVVVAGTIAYAILR